MKTGYVVGMLWLIVVAIIVCLGNSVVGSWVSVRAGRCHVIIVVIGSL